MSDLKEVNEKRYNLLLENDLIKPSWDVVREYQAYSDELPIIAKFIDKHATELSATKLTEEDHMLQVEFLSDNSTLSIDGFKLLTGSCVTKFEPDEIEDLDEERVEILLEKDLIYYSHEYNTYMQGYSDNLQSKYLIKYFDEFMEDEEDVDLNFTNQIGLNILNSTLTLEQKQFFLTYYARLNDDPQQGEYAKQICFYYDKIGCGHKATKYELITKALELYQDADAWPIKISLINKVHKATTFNEERTKRMVDSLGAPYTELNAYSHKTTIDDNAQNNELVNYLKKHGRYISNIFPRDGNLRITYRIAHKS